MVSCCFFVIFTSNPAVILAQSFGSSHLMGIVLSACDEVEALKSGKIPVGQMGGLAQEEGELGEAAGESGGSNGQSN